MLQIAISPVLQTTFEIETFLQAVSDVAWRTAAQRKNAHSTKYVQTVGRIFFCLTCFS